MNEKKFDINIYWKKYFKKNALNYKLKDHQKLNWDNLRNVIARDRMIISILKKLNIKKFSLCDIGCGNARYANFVNSKFYVGIDYTSEFINTLKYKNSTKLDSFLFGKLPFSKKRIKYKKIGSKNYFCVNDVNNLNIKSNSFDITIAIGLLQHINYLEKAIHEIIRITKPNGYIIINTLRQFTDFELKILNFLFLFNKIKKKEVKSIKEKNYFNGLKINNKILHRRYSIEEIFNIVNQKVNFINIYYSNFLGFKFLSKEFTIIIKKNEF
jgi:ubiquinone/menaquinone biosynthesis C-methylase UbiE